MFRDIKITAALVFVAPVLMADNFTGILSPNPGGAFLGRVR